MYQPKVWAAGKNNVQGMVSHIAGAFPNKMSSSSEASYEQSAMGIKRQGSRRGEKRKLVFAWYLFKIKLCCKMCTVSTQTSDVGVYSSFLICQNLNYNAFGLQACIFACAIPSLQMCAAS